uniref:Uncharacterized protein n=1 Tax=Anguilla anguilla TaxID=7936 RepID=A0A0E9W738_ANGAN
MQFGRHIQIFNKKSLKPYVNDPQYKKKTF